MRFSSASGCSGSRWATFSEVLPLEAVDGPADGVGVRGQPDGPVAAVPRLVGPRRRSAHQARENTVAAARVTSVPPATTWLPPLLEDPPRTAAALPAFSSPAPPVYPAQTHLPMP